MRLTPCCTLLLSLVACLEVDANEELDDDCLVGDPNGVAELRAVSLTGDDQLLALSGDEKVSVFPAPQGGAVALIGARVKNADACTAHLTVHLRDRLSGMVVGSDSRPVTLDVDAEGWASPDPNIGWTQFANVPICPVPDAVTQLDDLDLRVQYIDRRGVILFEEMSVGALCDPSSAEACASLCELPGAE
jgi:hypothetical protein